jgi:diguanylate cyclase (GGDEF)-like protein/PAS domain S-box-containing protein
MSFDLNNFENGNNKNLLVMVIDNQGRIIFLNKSMEKFTGQTFQELKELKVWDLYIEEDDRNTLKEHFIHFNSDLFPRKFKGKMQTTDGEGQMVKWTNNILLNRDDQIDRVICFGKILNGQDDYEEYEEGNISEAANDMQASKTDNKHCFCIVNDKGKILDISDSYCDLSGYSRQELLKMSIQDMIGNNNGTDLSVQIQKIIKDGYSTFSARQHKNNGDLLDIKINANYTQNFGGLIFLSINDPDTTEAEAPKDQNKPEFRQYLRAHILDKVIELIFIHDFNGNLIYVNETACRKLGYDKKELFEIKHDVLLSQDNTDTYENFIKQLINKNEINIECKYTNKKDKELDIVLHAEIMSVSNRKLILSIAREKNETLLNESDTNELINNVPDAFSLLDKECIIKKCNESFCNLCGHDIEYLTGMSLEDLLITNGQGKLKQYLGEVEKGNTHQFNALIKHKSGKKINIEIGARHVPDNDDLFYVLLRNITKQKMLADGYKNSLEINNLLNNHARSIVYRVILTPKIRLEYISDSTKMILGYQAKEFYEDPEICYKIIHPDDAKLLRSLSTELIAKPQVFRCTRKDGEVIMMETSNKPVYDSNKTLVGYEGNAIDITRLKKTESDLNNKSNYMDAITRNLNIGVAVISDDYNVIWKNEIATKLLGEQGTKKCFEFIYGKQQICCDCKFQDNEDVDSGNEHVIVNCNKVCNDSVSGYEVMTIPSNNNGDKPTEIIAIFVPSQTNQEEKDYPSPESKRLPADNSDFNRSSSTLLCEMNTLLHDCINFKEARKTISTYLPRLFADFNGSMFLYKSSVNLFEPLISWGEHSSSSSIFPPESCLAIRRGKKHLTDGKDIDDICEHINKTMVKPYLEIPMIYQGEKIGLLHLQYKIASSEEQSGDNKSVFNDATVLLAQVVADQITTALTCFRLSEKLQEQAKQDPATGLFNRRYMEQALEREIYMATDNEEYQVGLIVMSLENFNDFVVSQGHQNGDFVLRNFGTLLKNGCAAEDIICRCDANKFAIIIPRSSQDNIKQKASNIYEIAKFINVGDKQSAFIPLHLSIGIALYPDHGNKTEDILKAAYNAVSQNKGRDNNEAEINTIDIRESVKQQ